MATRRRVEIFSASCDVCREAIGLVKRLACDSCEVVVLRMSDSQVAARSHALGVRSLPAVVVDGQLAACCSGRGVDEAALRAAGVGRPIP